MLKEKIKKLISTNKYAKLVYQLHFIKKNYQLFRFF